VGAPIDLVSERIEGAIVDSVRSCPSYWHGNRLVLDRPPDAAELERWRLRHRELFAWRGAEFPVVITWYDLLDVPPPEFADEVHVAMLAPAGCEVAPVPAGLRSADACDDAAWEAVVELARVVHPQYREFNRLWLSMLRSTLARRRGVLRVLVNERGVVVAGAAGISWDGVGRYADVQVHPEYRRRGCARYLVTSILADLRRSVDDVIIVAQAESGAERLYRSIGFVPILSIRSLER